MPTTIDDIHRATECAFAPADDWQPGITRPFLPGLLALVVMDAVRGDDGVWRVADEVAAGGIEIDRSTVTASFSWTEYEG